MSMNMLIPNKDRTRAFNPNRDVAHAFPGIVMRCAQQLDNVNQYAPVLGRIIKENDITEEQLASAVDALLKFTARGIVISKEKQDMIAQVDALLGKEPRERRTLQEALEDTGVLSQRPEALFVVTSMLGMVLVGYAYEAVFDATMAESDPVADLRELLQRGEDVFLKIIQASKTKNQSKGDQ